MFIVLFFFMSCLLSIPFNLRELYYFLMGTPCHEVWGLLWSAHEGFDIYYVFFGFDRSYALTIKSVPDGWTSNYGSGFGNAWSTKPGLPSDGWDIAPGMSQSGFIFQFSEQVGDIAFDATFVNPTDPNYPARFSGTTAPVPEPATILLLVAGMVGMGVYGRKRLRN